MTDEQKPSKTVPLLELTTATGPLVFENSDEYNDTNLQTECLLCRDRFNLNDALNIFLKHLFEVHNIIIEDFSDLPDKHEYISYWRGKFRENNMEEIIPSLHNFYIISDLLKEDKDLRHKLRLENTLKVQEFERLDNNYERKCLFCKLVYKGNRKNYFDHLTEGHNLQLGNPQNLVFIDEFIDKVDEKLSKLECLYCNRTFPDRFILKEHMRKKSHKQINPGNKEFDKYYIVNYLEPNKNWRKIQKEADYTPENTENTDDEYSDWYEKNDLIKCLFCKHQENDINILCLHMEADHDFDFVETTKNFDFYQKIKLVNYLRRQIHQNKCGYCGACFENLQQHLFDEKHCKAPEERKFDLPQYYFSTFENDVFLYFIEDVED